MENTNIILIECDINLLKYCINASLNSNITIWLRKLNPFVDKIA